MGKPKANKQIGVGSKAAEQLRAGLRQVEQFNIFLSGIRVALNVPDDWRFDPKRVAFVPPPKKEKE